MASSRRRQALQASLRGLWLEEAGLVMKTIRARWQSADGGPHIREQRRHREHSYHRLERGSAPAPIAADIDPREAEALIRDWMRHMGALDAEVTPYANDGGVDVQSRKYVAQVKHYAAPVGVAAIRELRGVAGLDGRAALFFARSGYTRAAIDFADRADVALFVYSESMGTLKPINASAKKIGP